MASWFIPLRPCWVNIQEVWLFPFVKIRLGIEYKCCNILPWSENVPVLLCPHSEIPKQDLVTVSPLLLLVQLLCLLVETQHPIFSDQKQTISIKSERRFLLLLHRSYNNFQIRLSSQPSKWLLKLQRFLCNKPGSMPSGTGNCLFIESNVIATEDDVNHIQPG